MKKLFFSFLTILVFISCNNNDDKTNTPIIDEEEPEYFYIMPELKITAGGGNLLYSISETYPDAESFDIYYKLGIADPDELKTSGTKINVTGSEGAINGLNERELYSVVAVAKCRGFHNADSNVSMGRTRWKSPKRGVGYGFNFPRPNNSNSGAGHNNPAIIAKDIDLLGIGITWWYSWGTDPGNVVGPVAREKKLPFVPMVWGGGSGRVDAVRKYVTDFPEQNTEYLLAWNEPNFLEEANLTPAQASAQWPYLMEMARDTGLKVISPAMNYGTMAPYSNPTLWLEEFFGFGENAGFENVSLDDIDGVAIHLYNLYASGVLGYVDRFRKFGKPIWMTEWCAYSGNPNAEHQINFMCQSVILLEADPAVERYAWYIPKGGTFNHETAYPWNKLLTGPPPPALPELTTQGKIFVHMSMLDKELFYIPGEIIPAKDFSGCNISELVPDPGNPFVPRTGRSWQDGVRFRPTTNLALEASPLDIVFFGPDNNTGNMWVEYQIKTSESGEYALTMCYTAQQDIPFEISINGSKAADITLSRSTIWNSAACTVNLSAGKSVIRLRRTATTSGVSCAINWLTVTAATYSGG